MRAIDIESWALLIPGGFVGRVASAFGARAVGFAAAAALVERLLLGALACVVVGHYAAEVAVTAIAGWRFTGLRETGGSRDVDRRRRDRPCCGFAPASATTVGRDTTARGVWIGVGRSS